MNQQIIDIKNKQLEFIKKTILYGDLLKNYCCNGSSYNSYYGLLWRNIPEFKDTIVIIAKKHCFDKIYNDNNLKLYDGIKLYRIFEINKFDQNIEIIINNVFTESIRIKILIIKKDFIQDSFLSFNNHQLCLYNYPKGIISYYFEKFSFDKQLLVLITLFTCLKAKLCDDTLKDILCGKLPNKLIFICGKIDYCVNMASNFDYSFVEIKEDIQKPDLRYNSAIKKYRVTKEKDQFSVEIDFVSKINDQLDDISIKLDSLHLIKFDGDNILDFLKNIN